MVNAAQLQALGMTPRENADGLEAELSLERVSLINPLTRTPILVVQFTVVGDRLIPIAPAELVGVPPLSLAGIQGVDALEGAVSDAFNEHMGQVQRRSSQLQALGLQPKVDPASLELSSELEALGFKFRLVADRRGNLRVAQASRDGKPLETQASTAFELSEFRESASLAGYLAAMFGVEASAPSTVAGSAPGPLLFSEIANIFAANTAIPPTSPVELLVELRVNGALYRFAAARVTGRTFRGLFAGQSGKLWAERFELGEFPGVRALAADLLKVPQEQIELLGAPPDASEES